MNSRTVDTRLGGRSRHPGRVALSPAADIGGSIAEAERLRRDGALPQALQVLGRTVDLTQAVPGTDPVEVCTARRMLAEVMCEMGDPAGAYDVLAALVADTERTFGPLHPASVRSLAVLAAVVHEMGDLDAAERLYREVGERIGDRESRAGSLVRVRLALLQRDRGLLDQAREGLTEAYHKHRDAFGGEDPDTVHIAAQLAELHRDACDSAAARRVLTVAYVSACSSLGEGHELTRRLECDLEALEPPMPSAPVDLPEDSQSTRGLKRRHSKKGASATPGPAPAAQRRPAPAAPPMSPVSPAPRGPVAAAPVGPPVGPPRPAAPAAPVGSRRPSPVVPFAPAPPPPMASAAAPFEAPPQVARPPRPAPGAGQPRRRPVDPDGSVGGRRTRAAARHPALAEAPTALVQPLSPVRVGALAAADTVITPPVVVDPVSSRPAARRTAPKSTPPSTGRAARVVVIMMVIMAIATGVALSVIGYMLATQGS